MGDRPPLRLAHTYRIDTTEGHTVDPPGVAAARWAGAALGPGRRLAAEETDARLFQAYGRQFAWPGPTRKYDLLHSLAIEPWQPPLIRRYSLSSPPSIDAWSVPTGKSGSSSHVPEPTRFGERGPWTSSTRARAAIASPTAATS